LEENEKTTPEKITIISRLPSINHPDALRILFSFLQDEDITIQKEAAFVIRGLSADQQKQLSQYFPPQGMDQREKLLPKERGNRPNVHILVLDHFGRNQRNPEKKSHGEKMREVAEEKTSSDRNIRITSIPYINSSYNSDTEIIPGANEQIKKIIEAESHDTVFVLSVSLKSRHNPQWHAGLFSPEFTKYLAKNGSVIFSCSDNNDWDERHYHAYSAGEYRNDAAYYVSAVPRKSLSVGGEAGEGMPAGWGPGINFIYNDALYVSPSTAAVAGIFAEILAKNPTMSLPDAIHKLIRIAKSYDSLWKTDKWYPEWNPIRDKSLMGWGLIPGEKDDQAMLIDKDVNTPKSTTKYGGIDLTSENLPLQTQGNEIKFNMPFSGLPCIDSNEDGVCESLDIEAFKNIPGLTPVIFSIIPLTNIPQFFGLGKEEDPYDHPQKEPVDLSLFDHKNRYQS